MISWIGIFERINGALPLFSYGERHIEEFLNGYSFDRDGVRQRWEMFDRLWGNVQDFLKSEFPGLREIDRRSICELQMYPLRDKIARIEREYECYRSIVEQHPRPLAEV